MKKLIVILLGGLSGERKISFLTGKACSIALKKKGYKVLNLDAKDDLSSKLKKIKPKYVFFPHWSKKVSKKIIDNFFCICFHGSRHFAPDVSIV